MSSRLQEEIKQNKPFHTIEEEAYLNIVRTEDKLAQPQHALFKSAGITGSQYNVLRILRGAGEAGLTCGQIAERMLTRDPDVTRLLDRLEQRGLASRGRDSDDRRVVVNRVTEEGLSLLARLDAPLAEIHVRQLGHLGKERLRQLVSLLELARERVS